MHLIYGECRCNASAAARLYRERYPNLERYPDHRVFDNVHHSLTEGGHFPNQIRGGGRPSFPYEEEVLQEVADDPKDVRLIDRRHMWYQQDGCPAHFAVQVKDFLDQEYPGRWIGRSGTISWPARSPDLNILDFFYWGVLKEKV
ncbi:hypothetical protein EVAR_83702_1 [Eumeta japonica]|uniref:DUF4817 domain-containing protein n=1 Tax=Eumeta variegata TaxID=151549 RepID=A0A4C1WAD6_EUMVA|nr:hypothetical protein EVAR_83702_1 [Eumeta japonica]